MTDLPFKYPTVEPSDLALAESHKFVGFCCRLGFKPDRVTPSVQGGVTVSFYSGPRSAAFEFSNDGQVAAVISDGVNFIDAWAVTPGGLAKSAKRALDYVHQHRCQ